MNDLVEPESYYNHWSHGDITDGGESNPGDPEERWAVIDGRREVEDPLSTVERRPFRINPASFLQNAVKYAPADPEPTASAFGGWVYSLYSPQNQDGLLLENDRKESIFSQRYSKLSEWVLLGTEEWKIIHDNFTESGHEDFHSDDPLYYEIPELSVHGIPLRASPDIVYQHKESRRVFIVSIGFTSKAVPTNLWPDVWAQLWAYSRIPAWRPYVTNVVGEVWGRRHPKMERMVRPWDMRLRAVVRRDPRDRAFDRFFSTLFDIYRGIK